jgi:hypothetical protein
MFTEHHINQFFQQSVSLLASLLLRRSLLRTAR